MRMLIIVSFKFVSQALEAVKQSEFFEKHRTNFRVFSFSMPNIAILTPFMMLSVSQREAGK